MLPSIFSVQSPQHLSDNLPCTVSLSARSKAITELPRFVVKRRARPLKNLNTPIPQDHEVVLTQCGLPGFVSGPATRRIVVLFFHIPRFLRLSARGRLLQTAGIREHCSNFSHFDRGR